MNPLSFRQPAFVLILALVLACTLGAGAEPRVPEPDLRTLRTRHYVIHTDIERQLAEQIGLKMDLMFDEYARRLEAFAPDREHERFEVYLFNHRRHYQAFTHGRFPNTGGVFIPRRNLLASFLHGQGRDRLDRVLRHEAFHQFAHTHISPDLPVWLNEGLAQIFEEGIHTSDGFRIALVPPRRLRMLRVDVEADRLTPLREMVGRSHEQWQRVLANDLEQAATQYNQAWAMAWFLVHSTDNEGKPRYRARLIRMLTLLRAGQKPQAAFEAAFGDRYDNFEKRFLEWIEQAEVSPLARSYEHHNVLADMLEQLDAAGERFDSVRAFRKHVVQINARIEYTFHHVTWSTADDPRLYFCDEDGTLLSGDALYLAPRAGSPLPDLVRKLDDQTLLRTRFYESNGEIDRHTTVVSTAHADTGSISIRPSRPDVPAQTELDTSPASRP